MRSVPVRVAVVRERGPGPGPEPAVDAHDHPDGHPKVPAPVDLAHILTAYLKLKGVKIAVREELAPTLTKPHTDRADLSRVQTNNTDDTRCRHPDSPT